MKKNILSTFLLMFFTATIVFAQTQDFPNALKNGLSSFEDGDYQEALLQFREIIIDSSESSYHGDAYYWTGRSHLALGNIDKAARNIDFFIAQYPGHRLTAGALYQKGRILFLQKEYEKAIRQLNSFIEAYPDNDYVSNAYFWVGESFYSLGHFDKAEQIYSYIVATFPRSFKYEAANYRASLIELKQREQELLRLLKISHEEYLNALDEFEQREKTYEQAISSYQRQLSAATGDKKTALSDQYDSELSNRDTRITQLLNQLDEERNRSASLQNRINALEAEKPAAPVQQQSLSAEGDKDEIRQLLELKNAALSLKLFYIEWLQDHQE